MLVIFREVSLLVSMKLALPFSFSFSVDDSSRPSYLNQQPWLAIEIPDESYATLAKSELGMQKGSVLLHYPRLQHINKIYLIRPEVVQVSCDIDDLLSLLFFSHSLCFGSCISQHVLIYPIIRWHLPVWNFTSLLFASTVLE